ncbi:hypothetical protein AB4254_12150 [Vibrio breoganii]
MLLYRGQNKSTNISVTEDRSPVLGANDGSVYFMGHVNRHLVPAYAFTNYNVLIDSDCEEDEFVELGTVFICQYKDSEPTMLNDVQIDELGLDADELSSVAGGVDDAQHQQLVDLLEYSYSAYDAIQCLSELLKDGGLVQASYNDIKSHILKKAGTTIARAVDPFDSDLEGEYVVYGLSDVKQMKAIDITYSEHNVRVGCYHDFGDMDAFRKHQQRVFDKYVRTSREPVLER